MEQDNLLVKLIGMSSVSGFEKFFSEKIAEFCSTWADEVSTDRFGNVIALQKSRIEGAQKIMISVHMDEPGILVKAIDEKGFLSLMPVGGIDPKVLVGAVVEVHGKEKLTGVIGAKPPHAKKEEDKLKGFGFGDISVDLGMSAEKVRKLVRVGDLVTHERKISELCNKRIAASGLDNKAAVSLAMTVAGGLVRFRPQADIYWCFTVQEELDYLGASAAASRIEPDFAVVLEACHGEMKDMGKDKAFALGKGPVLTSGPAFHEGLRLRAKKLADTMGVPTQWELVSGKSGTEAWPIQIMQAGVPVFLLSIPVRAMHTPAEVSDRQDIQDAARLLTAFLLQTAEELEDMLSWKI